MGTSEIIRDKQRKHFLQWIVKASYICYWLTFQPNMWPSLLISYLQSHNNCTNFCMKRSVYMYSQQRHGQPKKDPLTRQTHKRCTRIPLATPSKGGAKGCQKSWGLCWFYLNYFGFNDPFIINCFLYKVMKFLKFKCYLFLVHCLLFFFIKKIRIYHLCVTIDSLIFLLFVNFFIKLR